MKNQSFAIVISTAACSQEAEKIALALIRQKLAACVQVLPIKSYFTWQNKLNVENESLLLIKCKCSDYEEIEKCIKANHSYEVPEIIQVPIENGLGDYLNWIGQVTR
mgnify:FL=1